VTVSAPTVTASVPYDPELHPHAPAGSPKGGQFAPKGTSTAPKKAPPPAKKTPPPPAKKAPAAKPAAKKPAHKPPAKPAPKPVATPTHGHQPVLHRGGAHNDPARVKDLQVLLGELGLGKLAVDGQYGPETEAAVAAAQRKLGLKPTGRAGSGLIRRLHDAHALSPCVGKSGSKVHAAAEYVDDEPGAVLIDTLPGDAFDVSIWSDGTLWLTGDGETGLVELDRDDAVFVAESLRDLEDDDEVRVSDWLTVRGVDGGAVLEADDDEDVFAVDVPAADLDRLVEQLSTAEPVAAALGHDVTPGHDELHHYWTIGPGRHEWVDSLKPWTTLLALLVEHVKPPKPIEVLKRWASAWFKEVKGYSAGSDLNRVAHGHPPRGHLVGPG
jgi:hypothetical protein